MPSLVRDFSQEQKGNKGRKVKLKTQNLQKKSYPCGQNHMEVGQMMGANRNGQHLGIRSTRKKFNLYSKLFE